MLRTLRALLLVVALLASYGLHLLLEPLLGPSRAAARLERVHARNAARVTTAFTELRGVFIKLGQVLSVLGSFLPLAYGRALERLQDRVPPRPFAEISGRLESALGAGAVKRFRQLDEAPIAAASLAQVHRAVTADGRPVAVKVLYPGIERLIRGDLAVLRFALPALQLLLPVGRLDRALEQLTAMLGRETDYAQERKNLARMRAAFGSRGDVVVPGVIEELSGPGVLTMTYEEGLKITDFDALAAAGIDRNAVATLLVDCYFEMLFENRLFHADPHPGNFLVRPGPVLVILDHGAVEEVTPALAEGMQEVLIGGISRDAERVLQGLDRMGFVAEGGDRE
ncbi:MAG: AarF/ABC1/UbiB kinase family protein, partial [Deltaproteobacteria bacterium]|nr:AarF/ABC1/UbiB kinase family protein [Deltaproteobacteria bacterium]